MKKKVRNTLTFLIVIFIAIIFGRLFPTSNNNNLEIDNKKEITLNKDEKPYEKVLPLFKKIKEYSDDSRYEETIALLKESLKEIPKLKISENEKEINTSITLNKIGEYYQALGLYEKAIDYYLKSISSDVIKYEPFKEKAKVIIPNLQKLSSLYKAAGELSKARATLIYTLELIKENFKKEIFITFQILSELGEIFAIEREYGEAERFYEYAISGIQTFDKEHPFIERIELNLAEVFIKQKKYEAAEHLLLKKTNNKSNYNNYNRLSLLSDLYIKVGQFDKAEKLLVMLINSSEEYFGSDNPNTLLPKAKLAYLYDSQYLFSKAAPYYLELLKNKNLKSIGDADSMGSFFNNLGYNFMARGFNSQAESFFKTSIEIDNLLYTNKINSNLEKYSNLALLYSLNENAEKAIFYYDEAIRNSLLFIQKEVPYLLLYERQRFIESNSSKYMMPFAWAANDNSYKNVALLSRLNHQGILEQIEANQSKLNLVDPKNIKLKNEIKFLTNQISLFNNDPQKIKELISLKRAKEKILYLNVPKLEPRIVEIKEVADALPENGVLIEFQKYSNKWKNPFNDIQEKPSYLALILKPNGMIDVKDLGSADLIENKIKQAIFNTKQGNNIASDNWKEVSNLIIKPLEKYLKGHKQIFITPDSELNRIPFAALGSIDGKGFLNDDFKLHILTTGRELLDINLASDKPNSRPLILANPDFDMNNLSLTASNKRSDMDNKNIKWGLIPESYNEGKFIKDLIKGKLLVGKEATASFIQKEEVIPKIIHIASHSFYDLKFSPIYESTLQNSGIVLAGANIYNKKSEDDGYLTSLEISKLNWEGVDLVVISGCQSGEGDLLFGEGIYGLKRAIKVAGARSSLLSLWEVDDKATSVFMQNFYKRLISGLSKTEALTLTQKDFISGKIKSEDPNNIDWRKPFYWAAFQLSGDWKPIEI